MKPRLNLAVALLHAPELTLLDEPTVGVDPQSRHHLFPTLQALRERGHAMLYTSHSMDEVQRLCDRVAILDRGRLVACGTPAELANGGGIPPFIHKGNGEVERLRVGGFPLGHGLGNEFGYQCIRYTFSAGDAVILVSDGVVESIGRSGEMFGFKRLEQSIAKSPNGTARAMLDHLVREVNVFSDEAAMQDDFTIAILRVNF